MFNHVMLGTNDIERAARFYEAVLRVLGLEAPPASSKTNSGHLRLFFRRDGNTLGITQPIDDQPATAGNGSTVAFKCDSPQRVRDFHDAAVRNGGVSVEDPPGLRTLGRFTYYLAYVRDPDGNKLCAIHHVEAT
jgi:catechol 2,3-dioxygenase-like lactoylglutathione lyase family enzyme